MRELTVAKACRSILRLLEAAENTMNITLNEVGGDPALRLLDSAAINFTTLERFRYEALCLFHQNRLLSQAWIGYLKRSNAIRFFF